MSKLLGIAETLILEKVVMSGFPVSNKSKAGMGLMLFSALLMLVAVGYLIVAFHIWIAAHYPPDQAALITAGAVFALAVAVALSACAVLEQRHRRAASIKDSLKDNLQTMISSFDDELGDHVRENPTTAMILATVAGFLLADKIL